MNRKKLLFIFNPKSGSGTIRNHLLSILMTFSEYEYEVTVHPTREVGDAFRNVPLMADKYDLIVCSGGDGTLDEVVSGMMHCDFATPIGYIPAGTTNDFASSLKIPKNMQHAANIAVGGDLFPCDVGQFNDDYFIYVAAFGLFTDVSYTTNQTMKNILGQVAYFLEGAKRLHDIPSYTLDIEVNGEKFSGKFVYGMITNSTSVGGVKNRSGKDVHLDDGLFEVTLIKMPQNPAQTGEIITNLLRTKSKGTPYIITYKTDHITINSEESIPWTLDGEFGGKHKDVDIKTHYRRITFMVPPYELG